MKHTVDMSSETRKLNSLGFAKDPRDTRVLVAMSGGVDSSVVAASLVSDGYDVVGITLQLYDHGSAVSRPGACCAGADIRDARRVAAELDFPHYVLDYESRFKASVIDKFADSYLAGFTPVPCILCNQGVKFCDLLETAREIDADCMATGHYVRRRTGPCGAELHRAADARRDQSYFLFATTREQLEYLRFPLGHLQSKSETRTLAARFGLAVADKPDSQDICFVPEGSYASVIERLRPDASRPGDIVGQDGRRLGKHRGLIHYTVGQRRGLGIGGGEPLYVLRLDAAENLVIVGPRHALATRCFRLVDVNWLGDEPFEKSGAREVSVRVRSTRPPLEATLRPIDGTSCTVELFVPEEGVAPGQACVFYETDGTRVLGGGWIGRNAGDGGNES